MSWRGRLRSVPRAARIGVPAVVVALMVAFVAIREDGDGEVATADTNTTTSEETTTSSTTTTIEAATTTTVAATTSTVPPTTAPPTTAPPATAPTTTIPAAPPEFQAQTRHHVQGPGRYGIFYGTTYGGFGYMEVSAECRPGTVTVTVLENGTEGATDHPVSMQVTVDEDTQHTVVFQFATIEDGQVITAAVDFAVHFRVSGPSDHDVRIRYDCRG